MKSGAGDDPFADDPVEADEEGTREDENGDSEEPGSVTTNQGNRRGRDHDEDPRRRTARAEPADGDDGGGEAESAEIPWVLRRSRVKEDRNNVHQFFLRDEYSATEDEIMDAVAEELDIRGKDLKKLDVREAMVATADAEAIAATLSEWGYEYVD